MMVVAQPVVDGRAEPSSLVCSACGYGVARPLPPEHCPMCGTSRAWMRSSWRPFGQAVRETPGTVAQA